MLGSNVALLADTPGVTPDHRDVLLPRGQVGVVVEAKDPDVVIVEFADLNGAVHASASVSVANLLLLSHGPIVAKRKLEDLSVEEVLELARRAWPSARAAKAVKAASAAIAQIDTSEARIFDYIEADDTLCLAVSSKPIKKDVSYGWNMSVGYSADGEVVEITFLNASALWKS